MSSDRMYVKPQEHNAPYGEKPERIVTNGVEDARQAMVARARAVIEELGIHKTLADLQVMPEAIARSEDGILEIKQRMEDLQRTRLAAAKEDANMAELMAMASAPDEALNGKNAEIRDRAMKRHLAQDATLRSSRELVREWEGEIAVLAGQIEVLEVGKREQINRFRALCIVAESQKEVLGIYAQALK